MNNRMSCLQQEGIIMTKLFKYTRVVTAVSLALTTTVFAETLPCDEKCNQQENVGRIKTDSSISIAGIAANTEQYLVEKQFILHAQEIPEKNLTTQPKALAGQLLVKGDSGIGFSSGKHSLEYLSLGEIDKVVSQLKNKQSLKLHIIGHADNQRLSKNARELYRDNLHLSIQRAQAVSEYIRQKLNLSELDITVEGMSDKAPLEPNNTASGRAKNRRVEIVAQYVEAKPVNDSLKRETICHGRTGELNGMRISVDGQPVNLTQSAVDQQRCTDVALDDLSIKLQFDRLNQPLRLNINHAVTQDENDFSVQLQGYSNYLYFIDKAVIQIFMEDSHKAAYSVELDQSLAGSWKVPKELLDKSLNYRLRVYGKNGNFDQTVVMPLSVEHHSVVELEQQRSTLLAGFGESKLSKQNIPVEGGSLTINGDKVPTDHQVFFLGQKVPVTLQGDFVYQQILPANVHRAEIAIVDQQGNGQLLYRDLKLPREDWFYVGIADFTLGKNSTNGPIELISGNNQHFDGDLFVDGRLAFYAKGKWNEHYTVTASVDTREQPLEDIFSDFSAKDPASLFRRLEEDNHFSVYGDDSTLVEDAPTKGKFYFKVEDESSHFLWGNFHTKINQNDLTRIERGLYGAQLKLNSESTTESGERQSQLNIFAAEADSSAAYEELRGTGGSLYYLQHQDITRGSEQLAIEIRDKDSDLVLSRTPLIAGSEYNIDAIQGRVLLTRPLPSTSNDGLLIREGGISGHPTYLVINYEYTPGFEQLDDLTIGGTANHWFSDKVKVGVTASNQDMGEEDQSLLGVDFLYRHSADTYLKVESAESDGMALSAQSSRNGGYHFSPINSATNNARANAHRVESGFSLSDLGLQSEGTGQFYWQQKDAGYSGLGQLTQYDTEQVGGKLDWNIGEQTDLIIKLDSREETGGIDRQSAEINFKHELNEQWFVSAGIRNEETTPSTEEQSINTGLRTDAVVQLDYSDSPDWSGFVFAQATLEHDESRKSNDRAGLGGRYQINDKMALSGEISGGNLGLGSQIGADYQYSDASNIYLNYELDPDRTDNGIAGRNGQLVSGARHRFSDSTSVYGEERYLHGDGQTGLLHAYGVDYTPNERWTLGLAIETGEMGQAGADNIDREAVSFSIGYATQAVKYAGALEFREDETSTETRESWLARNNLSYQASPDWRTQLRVDVAISDSSNGNSLNSDFTEILLGGAYRPVDNDRFNALFTYNYLEDLAPAEQLTGSLSRNNYQQRSQILAVDANYDLTSRWSIGGKVARRTGEVRQGRETGTWFESTANLYIVRADWHLVKNWDFLIEGRLLELEQANDERSGGLIALQRHIGKHVKLGVGYNFTEFSDDLTHFDFDAKGWFVNLVGKF